MGGPNLEILKFSVYVFFPIVMMMHYGNPDWYEKHVKPSVDGFTRRKLRDTAPPIPKTRDELNVVLDAFKQERIAKRERREVAGLVEPTTPPSSTPARVV